MSDAFQWLYSPIVKEHFTNPKNVFNPDEAFIGDAEGTVGNIKCGDQMMFILKIEDDVITDVRWKTYGCASAIASTSMLSEVIKGMPMREAYAIKPSDIASRLGGLPENKIHCSVLGDKALPPVEIVPPVCPEPPFPVTPPVTVPPVLARPATLPPLPVLPPPALTPPDVVTPPVTTVPPVTVTFSRMAAEIFSASSGFSLSAALAASRPWPTSAPS